MRAVCIKTIFVNFFFCLINLPFGKTRRFSLESNERVADTKRHSFFAIWCGIKGESDFDHSVHLNHNLLSFSKIPHQTEITKQAKCNFESCRSDHLFLRLTHILHFQIPTGYNFLPEEGRPFDGVYSFHPCLHGPWMASVMPGRCIFTKRMG